MSKTQPDDRFVPDSDPKAPAFCARCNSRITVETAMERWTGEMVGDSAVYELVCLACYTIPAEEPNA